MRKELTALVCAAAACVAFAGGTESHTGLDPALDPTDPTNGGYWDVSGRASAAVAYETAPIAAAVDLTAKSEDSASSERLDTRALAWLESLAIRISTQLRGGLILLFK